MRRVLFILYYFPPSGGAGVQRGLKFLRYLPEFDWEATVLTVPADAAFPVRDETLAAEIPEGLRVIRTRAPELYGVYRRLSGQRDVRDTETSSQSAGERSLPRRTLRALRAAFFVPDGRMLWAPFAVRAGKRLLASERFDAIVSSGPPFTCQVIGRALHRASGLRWVADYRDPWTQATFYPQRPALSRSFDRRLEAACIREASCNVVVGEGMAAQFRERYPARAASIVVVPNGYDEADFAGVPYRFPQEFRITHSGSLFRGRIPFEFFDAVREWAGEHPSLSARLRLCFAGRIDDEARAILSQPPFDRWSELPGYLSHAESVALLRRSRLLLLSTGTDAQSKSLVTGKVYEYLASGVPVLALAPPDGDAAALIASAGAGWTLSPHDRAGIAARLRDIAAAEEERERAQGGHTGGGPSDSPAAAPLFGLVRNEEEIARYSRRELTRRLVRILEGGCGP